MLTTILRRWRDRAAMRLSLGRLLARRDDRLLQDIGLDRAEAEALTGAEPGAGCCLPLIRDR